MSLRPHARFYPVIQYRVKLIPVDGWLPFLFLHLLFQPNIPYNHCFLMLFAEVFEFVVHHQFILKEVWGTGFQTDTQYLRVFVGTLRKKIEDNPNQPKHIITESGVGYRFS